MLPSVPLIIDRTRIRAPLALPRRGGLHLAVKFLKLACSTRVSPCLLSLSSATPKAVSMLLLAQSGEAFLANRSWAIRRCPSSDA